MAEVRCGQHTSNMSFWSRDDVGQYVPRSTDHWAKTRTRTMTMLGQPSSSVVLPPIKKAQRQFDQIVMDELESSPGQEPKRASLRLSREKMRNEFNSRAREDFHYWLIERPKPTSFGRYGMGSYKTVLGIGNAPRT